MDREGFRNRMKQYKEAKGFNPQLMYWDWKQQYVDGNQPDLIPSTPSSNKPTQSSQQLEDRAHRWDNGYVNTNRESFDSPYEDARYHDYRKPRFELRKGDVHYTNPNLLKWMGRFGKVLRGGSLLGEVVQNLFPSEEAEAIESLRVNMKKQNDQMIRKEILMYDEGGEVETPQTVADKKAAQYRQNMRNYVLDWYNERLKQPEYQSQIGDYIDGQWQLKQSITDALGKDTYMKYDDFVKNYGKPAARGALNPTGGTLIDKNVWFGKDRPSWWHEGIGHIVGDKTPSIMHAAPDTNIQTGDSEYDNYVNLKNEKHASTWEFRGMNMNHKDAQGNKYIDPNRKLTGEDVQQMIDSGAYIPTLWKDSSISPEDIANMHNTFANVDRKQNNKFEVFTVAEGGIIPKYGEGTPSAREKNSIPTQEEYIAEQIAAKKAKALEKSLSRTTPRVPFGEKRGERWNPVTKKVENIYECGPSCAYTFSDNYGQNWMSSEDFRQNHEQYGFKQVSWKDRQPGDAVLIVDDNGVGTHTMMYDSDNAQGQPLFNHSNGGHDESAIRKKAKYPHHNPYLTYEYVGTPADSTQWKNEYKQLYGYADGGEVDDPRKQIINRSVAVASNYDDAKDFTLDPFNYAIRKLSKTLFGRGGISNCTLSATGWIDPNNQYMSAKNLFNNPESGYVEVDKEYALPGDLLIAKNPEKDSYHTMLIEGFDGDDPLLRYSRGGHNTKKNLVTGRSLKEYHRLDNEQGGNHTEDHYFRYNIPNEYWLPEIVVTPKK